jgi:hypothetical protein
VITLDINGRTIQLTRQQAEQLRDEATARAAASSSLRDLSLVLDRAIRSTRVVSVQHGELRALARLLRECFEGDQFAELAGSPTSARSSVNARSRTTSRASRSRPTAGRFSYAKRPAHRARQPMRRAACAKLRALGTQTPGCVRAAASRARVNKYDRKEERPSVLDRGPRPVRAWPASKPVNRASGLGASASPPAHPRAPARAPA